MIIREAVLEDRSAWDAFVDDEGGSFFHYFDWKYVHESRRNQFIPLLIESASSQLIGILPIVKENRLLYSTLDSGTAARVEGLLLKGGLREDERHEATVALLKHVDMHYSRRCSSFRLTETLTPACQPCEEPTAALINNGFRFRYDRATRLPCDFVLELKQPFEENIWRRWSTTLRKSINRAVRSGVVVVQDRELKHVDDFAEMLTENYRRHGTKPLTRDEIMLRLNVFRDKTKLFVALLDGKPVVTLLCHYTPSTCYLAKVGTYQKDTDYANRLCFKVIMEDACNAGYRLANLGYAETPSLAFFKERFKTTRVPVRIYEKSYSVPRTVMEKAPFLVRSAWHDKGYVWRNRRKIWDRIAHL